MRIKRPSPSMVVACIALVLATTGTAVAAVNYATNAGKVDGKDAVASSATLSQAAGDVVATARRGTDRGKIPGKFLADVMRGGADSFSRVTQVADNGTDVPTAVTSVPALGTLSVSCFDEEPAPGVENPASTLRLDNTSGVAINVALEAGQQTRVFAQLPGAQPTTLTVRGSTPFRLHAQKLGTNYVMEGVVRQDGRNTNGASCVVYGYALRVIDTN